MTHSHNLCYGKCGIRCIEEVLELLDMQFWGLKAKFDVKMARFRDPLDPGEIFVSQNCAKMSLAPAPRGRL